MPGHHLPARPLRALAFLSVLVMASALPPLEVGPEPELLLVHAAPPDSEQRAEQDRQALPADLNGTLAATRARLEELSEAMAKLTADTAARQEGRRLKQENERLAAELERASAVGDQLERSGELSSARIAELSADLETARHEAIRLARTAREAATGEAEESRAERVEAVERSGAETERMKTELAEAKEQLSQAMAAVSDLERARQAASHEANMLRGEAERARQELIATKAEIRRLVTANAGLEMQVIALRIESSPAIEAARGTQKLAKLDAALPGVARSEGAPPPRNPEVMPDPAQYEEPAAAALPSAMRPPPVAERAAETGTDEPAANAAQLAATGPHGASPETGSGLADFHASVQVLNDLERGATGIDLFSDIAFASARAVHINATPAWDALPPVAKRTYLDTLFDEWAATQGGKGPAVVRIVDPGGRVLIEKSSP